LNSGSGFITIEEFRPFCATHEVMLNPLFEVQNKLRQAAMGPAFWDGMARRKIDLGHGHCVELGELMVRVSTAWKDACVQRFVLVFTASSLFRCLQASDREEFNRILHEKSRGIRSLVRSMFESAEHSLHPSGNSVESHVPSTSEKSVGRLFNPFRTMATNSQDTHEQPKEAPSIVPTVAANCGDSMCESGKQ
jgi:hypothetical protein